MVKKLALSLLIAAYSLSAGAALHVVIDPGHGGSDRGATAKAVEESQLALQISQRLKRLLDSRDDFKITMTRTDDRFVSLEKRADIANRVKADLFLSIHLNSSTDPRAKGAEVYFQNQLPPDEQSLFLAGRENSHSHAHLGDQSKIYGAPDQLRYSYESRLKPDVRVILQDLVSHKRLRRSAELAKSIVQEWTGLSKLHRRNSVRQAPFFVISNVDMPAVLLELGFLSNAKEHQLLVDPKYQQKLTSGLLSGLLRYKDFIDKSPHSDLH